VTTAWRGAFADRVVLVTGASSGIGRATAAAFASAGARVALVARRRPELERLATEIAAAGGRAMVAPADVTDRTQVAACFDAVTAELGPIDVVVNNAGVLRPAAIEDLTAADLQAMLQVNLFGALYVIQEALARMRPRNVGTIVNVGSLAGRRGVAPLGGYCATKFALIGLTEAVRTELDASGVHVALVLPGVVETPMVEAVDQDPDFVDLWPPALNMPPSWVVWAIFAAVRFRLVEVSVPPGAALLEKLAALAPGAGDTLVRWVRSMSRWVAESTRGGER
jgi:NAD(P)-dependent dehydrogenase (short-subunit alcohol dehydrogenase family)